MSAGRKVVLVIGGVVLVLLTAFTAAGLLLFERYRPPTSAMEPTVMPGDRIWTRPAGDVDAGDIVLLVPPPRPGGGSVTPFPRPRLVITRVVAVGGDTVEARGGRLRVDGAAVDEPYLEPGTATPDFDATRVPAGHVFFVGDNRQNSVGSPYLGPAPLSDVEERVSWIGAPSMGLVVAANLLLAFGYVLWCIPHRPWGADRGSVGSLPGTQQPS